MVEEGNPELEHFRKQWKEEVTARSRGASSKGESKDARPLGPLKGGCATDQSSKAPTSSSWSFTNLQKDEETWDGLQTQSYHDLENKDDARRLGEEGAGIHPESHRTRDPRSALEHYEKAVERETEGNLGDSLNLYRKAYRVHIQLLTLYA
jgi:F-box protein 9